MNSCRRLPKRSRAVQFLVFSFDGTLLATRVRMLVSKSLLRAVLHVSAAPPIADATGIVCASFMSLIGEKRLAAFFKLRHCTGQLPTS